MTASRPLPSARRPSPHPRPRPRPFVVDDAPARQSVAFAPTCPQLPPALGLRSNGFPRLHLPAGQLPVARLLQRRASGRGVSIAAIAAGAAVFVVASLVTPLAGADTAAKAPLRHAAVRLSTPSTSAGVTSDPVVVAQLPAAAGTPTGHVARVAASPAARLQPADHTVISSLASNGIPTVALNAYRVAAARMDNVDPSCGIDWALIAGIGREESDHGQTGGAVLHADGISTPEIIGPALNGTNGNRKIPAPPDGLALDGDAVYAHALGPMQFLPSTWAIYGVDADGDGTANIFDINDAALATARLLCADGGDLRTHAGQVRAVFAYNHVSWYVQQVLALAAAYRKGISVTGIPIGNTTGKLPKPKKAKSGKSKSPHPSHTKSGSTHRVPPKTLGGSTSPTPSPTKTRSTSHAPSPSPSKSPSTSKSPSPSPSSGAPSSGGSCAIVCLP